MLEAFAVVVALVAAYVLLGRNQEARPLRLQLMSAEMKICLRLINTVVRVISKI